MHKKGKAVARLLWVDALRGLAILLMVIFHFCYDLRHFGYVDWDVPNGPNWWPFRYLILTLFISTMGISLALAHSKGVRWRSFLKRFAQIVVAALFITAMSLVMFPDGWIYFGILHFIAFASLVGLLLVRFPIVAVCSGALILTGYWAGFLSVFWPFNLFSELLPSYTEDYVSVFPWLGVALLAAGLAALLPVRAFDLPAHAVVSAFANTGRYGLIIYVAHQPILFAGFYAFGYLFGAS